MKLLFVTGNQSKFNEAKTVLPDLEMINIDLDEIQEMDSMKIIEHKLQEAYSKLKTVLNDETVLFVEDSALAINSLNGFPGPLIKWYMKSLGLENIAKTTTMTGDNSAVASVTIGCMWQKDSKLYYEYASADVSGRIVDPKGGNGFGWDSIFCPGNYEKTFAEMEFDEKNQYNMRIAAFRKIKKMLNR